MIKEKILNRLSKAIQQSGYDLPQTDIEIDTPPDTSLGDYASGIALKLGSRHEENPRKIAQQIVAAIDDKPFKDINIAGPGFINFRLHDGFLTENLAQILRNGFEFEKAKTGPRKKIQVEFVSSNPTGPLTVGHGRQAVLGDVLASSLEALGHSVEREYYFNDEGNQISILARTLWVRYKQALGEEISIPERGYQGDYLVDLGNRLAEEMGNSYSGWNENTKKFFKQRSLEEMISRIKDDLESLNVKFDNWFRESSLHKQNEVSRALKKLREAHAVYTKDGATWLKAQQSGAPKDAVLVKSDDEPTYLLPDIAYHLNKYHRGFDKAIVLLGADHHRHVDNMKAALAQLGLPSDFYQAYLNQFVSLKKEGQTKRMSTRKGEYITLNSLVQDLGKDVVRYFMLARKPQSHLEFDYDLAKERSMDNPVYYVQYAYTRIFSIFEKANCDPQQMLVELKPLRLLKTSEERELIKKIDEFPRIVISAGEEFSPHYLCKYAEDLAASFHQFYNKFRVLSDNQDLTTGRLLLCRATQIILRDLLDLMGVSAPTRM